MPIYKGDVEVVNGKVVEGEIVEGNEFRFPYRMADSMTVTGVTYKFDRMEGGEAVYVKQAGSVEETQKPKKTAKKKKKKAVDTTPEMAVSDLPSGAILEPDFVGGIKHVAEKQYRLMQPITKVQGQYVYVPIN